MRLSYLFSILPLFVALAVRAQEAPTKSASTDGDVEFKVVKTATSNQSTPEKEEFAYLQARARLLVHSGLEIADSLALNSHMIFPKLAAGDATPLVLLELQWKLMAELQPSIAIGHTFIADEFVLSTRLAGDVGPTWYWFDIEWQPQSNAYYEFIQWQWPVTDWLQVGLEEESYGSFEDFRRSGHGGGPNLLFTPYKLFQLDVAWHIRHENTNGEDQLGWTVIVRGHIKLFKEKTTAGSGGGTPP